MQAGGNQIKEIKIQESVMSIFSNFNNWLKKNDSHILDAHIQKDRERLSESLNTLNIERYSLKNLLQQIDALLEDELRKIEKNDTEDSRLSLTTIDDLKPVQNKIKKILNKEADLRNDREVKYLKDTAALLENERALYQHRLHRVDEIIAKTKILLDELSEDECKELSNGHSIAAVNQALRDKFGPSLKQDQINGKKTIRQFLEGIYHIDRRASRELFKLLEQNGILNYTLDLAHLEKYDYYAPILLDEEESLPYGGLSMNLAGNWNIL